MRLDPRFAFKNHDRRLMAFAYAANETSRYPSARLFDLGTDAHILSGVSAAIWSMDVEQALSSTRGRGVGHCPRELSNHALQASIEVSTRAGLYRLYIYYIRMTKSCMPKSQEPTNQISIQLSAFSSTASSLPLFPPPHCATFQSLESLTLYSSPRSDFASEYLSVIRTL
jgi:hypothetical protein